METRSDAQQASVRMFAGINWICVPCVVYKHCGGDGVSEVAMAAAAAAALW